MVGLVPGCLIPPDFEFATAENMQTHVDRTAIRPIDGYQTVGECPGTAIEFDIRSAIINPDDDELFVTWYVNYSDADGGQFAQTDTEVFNFACDHPRAALSGDRPILIEVVVMDRRPKSLANAMDARTVDDPTTTLDIVSWYVDVEAPQ